jgi:GTP pyrophosphokinase
MDCSQAMLSAIDEHAGRTVSSLDDLLRLMWPRSSSDDLALIERAYHLAEAAHKTQKRSSGEAYITHPLAVAGILAETKLDAPTVAAALLHDVAEDTQVTLDDIRAQFGAEIASLVDAVTKLSKRESITKEFSASGAGNDKRQPSETFNYRTERDAESLRKMMLGLVKDVRVVLIKLADRLHNMRTMDAMPPEKQRRIARETLDIYAPLANRLGIWEWKQELEDLGFRYSDPEQYAHLVSMVEAGAAVREQRVRRYIDILRENLAEAHIKNVEITGRAKQIYSIWRKMQRKNTSFDQINDSQAIRVIIEDGSDENVEPEPAPIILGAPNGTNGSDNANMTNGIGHEEDASEINVDQVASELNAMAREDRAASERARRMAERARLMAQPAVQNCYIALGIVHRLWKPIPGEFDDYIAVPKDNRYQSLHTAVITNDGKTLEVQIRTRAMHRAAEFGVAAHWLYKDTAQVSGEYQKHIEQLREAIKAIGSDAEDATDFVDALKTDQFTATVFCFTPKGKLIELPAGSTILDFAYRIHSDIGDHCRGGKVNSVMQSLTYKLRNGDQVEVITRPNATPSRDWLHDPGYVATNAARSKIRQWFRKQDRAQNIAAGKEIVEREIKKLNVSDWLKLDDVYRLYKVEQGKEDDFLEKVGYGTITVPGISARIVEEERRRDKERKERLQGLTSLVPLFRPRQTEPKPPKKGEFIVAGVHGMHCEVAQCCTPIPGEPVIGYISRGQGVKVHRRDCKNVLNAETERLIDVVYVGASNETYPVQFLVTAAERTGLLADLTRVLAENKINITDIGLAKRDLKTGEVIVHLKTELQPSQQISAVMNRLKQVANVFEVSRIANGR